MIIRCYVGVTQPAIMLRSDKNNDQDQERRSADRKDDSGTLKRAPACEGDAIAAMRMRQETTTVRSLCNTQSEIRQGGDHPWCS